MADSSASLSTDAAAGNLPEAVVAALAAPDPGRELLVEAAGIPFAGLEWGDRTSPPLLLVHGVTAFSGIWWRVGPALAVGGRRVVAPDLPGHGRTGHWTGHVRFRETAADLAAFARTAGLDVPRLAVIGHSWGAMTAAELPALGLRPRVLILLEPPALPVSAMAHMANDPVERPYDDIDQAEAALRGAHPDWSDRDVAAKAEGLCRMDPEAVRSVLLGNGDWDGAIAALGHPSAAAVPTWLVRGDPAAGGMVPDAVVPSLVARLGADRVVTIEGAPHSPQRTRPEATMAALLRALG